MRITPLDIRHKEFKRGLRGYVEAEVDEFLDQIADAYESLFKENAALTERGRALDEKVAGYVRIDDALRKALVAAQTSAQEAKHEAFEAAQVVVREAEVKARQIMDAAYAEKQAMEQAAERARGLEEDFHLAFRQMLQGYLKQIEHKPEEVSAPVVGVPDARTDFARHADAIREAITREESAMQASGGASVPSASAGGGGGQPVSAPVVEAPSPAPRQPAPAVEPAAPRQPAPAVEPPAPRPPAPAVEPPAPRPPAPAVEPAAPRPPAPAVEPPAPRPQSSGRPGEGIRILFGERDDLLADVDSEVGQNGFKW